MKIRSKLAATAVAAGVLTSGVALAAPAIAAGPAASGCAVLYWDVNTSAGEQQSSFCGTGTTYGTWYSAGSIVANGHSGSVEMNNNGHIYWVSFGPGGVNLYDNQAAAIAGQIRS